MLIMKKEQMMMGISEEEGFVHWYANDFMSECLPIFYAALTTEERLNMVSNGRQIALQQNFHDPVHQTHFITFMWTIGANFYQQTGFKDIIQETNTSEAVKINKFHTEISEKQRHQAIEQTNDGHWFSETKNQ